MAWYDPIRHIVEPWIQFVRNIPPLAYVFLLIAWLASATRARSRVIFIAAFLVQVVTIYQGVQGRRHHAHQGGARAGRQADGHLLQVTIPATTPFILVAARLGLSTSLTTLMASEIVGGDRGLA